LADGLLAELLAHFSTHRRDLVSGAYLNKFTELQCTDAKNSSF